MAVEAYKQNSAGGGGGGGSGNGHAGGVGGVRRGASPLMDNSGMPGFGESSGYRAYQAQVMNYWQNKEARNGGGQQGGPQQKRFKW